MPRSQKSPSAPKTDGAITSTLDAPTQQDPKTHDEKVAAFEARRAEMRKDPTRR